MENSLTLSYLVTHYNRPQALERLVKAIRKMPLAFSYEIVVSDDASDTQAIFDFDVDKVVKAETNSGLASNINKGLRACDGNFILYCQEDFVPKNDLSDKLEDFFKLLENDTLDMIRLAANYNFPRLLRVTDDVSLIPRFCLKNYLYNQFRYSDNPFLVRRDFFDKYGFYLENTSTSYGENEYMVRIMKSDAKVGISNQYFFAHKDDNHSVNDESNRMRGARRRYPKSLHRHLRALRFFFEFLTYDRESRGLKTYKNHRA